MRTHDDALDGELAPGLDLLELPRGPEAGLVLQSKPGGVPRLKRYLDESKGVPIDTIWDDIRPVQAHSKERTSYPTQKPLALLERIIRASSDKDALVLDPFCGCATTCVAAEKLNRRWIGIDLSPLAVTLVRQRLQREVWLDAGASGQRGMYDRVIPRTDIPRRTDQGKLPNYRTHRHVLYGQQEGNCAGCSTHFPFRNLTVDHVIPRSKGGTDHLDNLQLLCSACNSSKGTLDQAAFLAKLKRQGLRA